MTLVRDADAVTPARLAVDDGAGTTVLPFRAGEPTGWRIETA